MEETYNQYLSTLTHLMSIKVQVDGNSPLEFDKLNVQQDMSELQDRILKLMEHNEMVKEYMSELIKQYVIKPF